MPRRCEAFPEGNTEALPNLRRRALALANVTAFSCEVNTFDCGFPARSVLQRTVYFSAISRAFRDRAVDGVNAGHIICTTFSQLFLLRQHLTDADYLAHISPCTLHLVLCETGQWHTETVFRGFFQSVLGLIEMHAACNYLTCPRTIFSRLVFSPSHGPFVIAPYASFTTSAAAATSDNSGTRSVSCLMPLSTSGIAAAAVAIAV